MWLALGGSGLALLCLIWAALGMTLYNFWGKRSPLPPLTDLLQGSSWASFLLFGALVVGQPTPQTWMAAGFIMVYILLVNGVNSSLRDLASDFAFGARTTALWLGARPFPPNQFAIPNRLRIFAYFWQFVLGMLAPFLPVVDKFPLSSDENVSLWLRLLMIMIAAQCYVSLWQSMRQSYTNSQRMPLHMLNNIWNLVLLFTAVLPLTDPLTRWAIIFTFTLPLFTADWLAEKLTRRASTQISTGQKSA
jgi:hypothetical protein